MRTASGGREGVVALSLLLLLLQLPAALLLLQLPAALLLLLLLV